MSHEIPKYMSANYVKDKTSVDILWLQLGTLQDIASEFGIDNIFQDNGAEILQQLIYLNMKAVPGREGNDGVDLNGCQWELKSLDISKRNGGITTNHHLNASIIEKYRTVPWSVSIYDGIRLKKIYVIGNEQLQPLFEKWEEQLQKVSSLNNPKIPLSYIEEHGILIYQEGDDYPIDPMTVIDTKPYVPVQKAYFEKLRREKEERVAIKKKARQKR
ncbi:MAG: restriction endonuclease [Clostridia bacterium]|nr:restriction endonuclease [Clostridia bacterium]